MVDAGSNAPGIHQPAGRVVVGGQQRTDPGPGAFGIGLADRYELLVQALDLEPQAAIARSIGRISSLRDDPFHSGGACLFIEGRAAPDLMIAVFAPRAPLYRF
jgi:hypothetical protein